MTSDTKVYIAGVGFTPSSSEGSNEKSTTASLVSAATKALLDAGLTFDNVTRGTRSKELSGGSGVFKAFSDDDVPIDEVKSGSELDSSISQIKDKGAQCVLMVATEKSGAVAIVLVSEDILWRHPYLKDSAALIRKSESSSDDNKSKEILYNICQTVWTLRGWSSSQGKAGKEHISNQSYDLSRADAKPIPKWKDIEHRQDGKHRLGYNPASKTKDISLEDFEAVRGSGGKQQKRAESSFQFKRKGGDRAALARL